MSWIAGLDLDRLTPSRIWSSMDSDARKLAARSVFRCEDRAYRAEADDAIADQLKFRPATVKKLPVEKRIDYLARAVHPDDSLATSLLLVLHLEERRPLLSAFLDGLGIPNDNGTILDDHDSQPPAEDDLRRASSMLFESFDVRDVELYLATLASMDPHLWGGLVPLLAERCPSSP